MENSFNSNEMSPETSLKVIYEMIQSAKSRIGKNYFYFLLWGYLVAFTCILEYVLITLVEYDRHYMVWPVFMLLGTLVTVAFYVRQKRSVKSSTFIGTAMEYLWLGWFISFGILMVFVNLRNDYGLILPLIMSMYGLAIFVAGGMVSFKPLIIGGIVAWVCSIIAFFTEYPVQLLIMTGMVIISHVIPGHILKANSKL